MSYCKCNCIFSWIVKDVLHFWDIKTRKSFVNKGLGVLPGLYKTIWWCRGRNRITCHTPLYMDVINLCFCKVPSKIPSYFYSSRNIRLIYSAWTHFWGNHNQNAHCVAHKMASSSQSNSISQTSKKAGALFTMSQVIPVNRWMNGEVLTSGLIRVFHRPTSIPFSCRIKPISVIWS